MRRNVTYHSIFLTLLMLSVLSCSPHSKWRRVDDGLYVGEFRLPSIPPNNVSITLIKIDPHLYRFHLLCISELGHDPLTTKEWCLSYNLIGAINAGMYLEDGITNVGYMANYQHQNNPRINPRYKSVAGFNSVNEHDTPFFLFDLDETPMDSVICRYHSIVQNLRLIKRPRENRWNEENRRWCEAALAQDREGNVILIYCRTPLNMKTLNNALLSLPVNIECAQHLEGAQPASLYFSAKGITKHFAGTSEMKFDASGQAVNATALPNVIGFSRRKQQ